MSSRVRTFVDAGVLIAAARGGDSRAMRAGMVLNDLDREYVSRIREGKAKSGQET